MEAKRKVTRNASLSSSIENVMNVKCERRPGMCGEAAAARRCMMGRKREACGTGRAGMGNQEGDEDKKWDEGKGKRGQERDREQEKGMKGRDEDEGKGEETRRGMKGRDEDEGKGKETRRGDEGEGRGRRKGGMQRNTKVGERDKR